MSAPSGSEDDTVTLLLLLTGGTGFGLFSVGSLLRPAAGWMVEHQILVTGDSVLIPVYEDAGLDGWRLAIATGMVILVVVAGAVAVRAFRNRRRDSDV